MDSGCGYAIPAGGGMWTVQTAAENLWLQEQGVVSDEVWSN